MVSVVLRQHGVEKHLLRDAFKGLDLIPEEILWRRKEAFSDGVMSLKKSWHRCLQEHLESMVETTPPYLGSHDQPLSVCPLR